MTNFERLLEIIAILRSQNGCPWDKEQTHQSLKPYIIEEAYEVLEAIEAFDDNKLAEELGDLLSQIAMHAQLANERGVFDIEDVCGKIVNKLIERHPHVFSQEYIAQHGELSSKEVLHNWEQIKLNKSNDKNYSVLQGVPNALPALLKAFRVQEKVGRYGFDWKKPEDVIEKVKEEIAEFEEALGSGEKTKQEHELGDLLFSLVNLARHLKMQPEEALNGTIRRFKKRFQYIEDKLRERGKSLNEASLEEMDRIWDEAKVAIT